MKIPWPQSHSKLTKLKELVLYVAEKSKDDPYFGATKLNKILFLADFNYYAWKGESLTGAKYVHREKGPCPNEVLAVLDDLQTEERATVQEVNYHGYTQKRLVPLAGPNTSIFEDDALSLVDEIIEKTKNANATEISDWTHGLKPWQITEEGEEIPLYSIFMLQDRPVGRAGLSWAMQEIKRLREEKGYAF